MSQSELRRVMRRLGLKRWEKMTPEEKAAHIRRMVEARLARKQEGK